MKEGQHLGQIITFYSFKGGVGRTMALANVAVLLAQQGSRVLMIDWDLEAPGLERYFDDYINRADLKTEGLIEFLQRCSDELPEMNFEEEEEDKLLAHFKTVEKFISPVLKEKKWSGDLFLLRAGNVEDKSYSDKILSFQWNAFFHKIPSFFPFFAYYLKEKFDYVLIDSRTGHTDAGGVCTMLLPDSLVLAFIPNLQNLNGVLALAEKSTTYRKNSPDLRPLSIYPLPCRIEINEKEERERWALKYTTAFEKTLQNIYKLPPISLSRYFDTPVIQSTFYAFGEKIAVIDESVKDSLSLSNAYSLFVDKLLSKQKIWDFFEQESEELLENKLLQPRVVQIYAKADEMLKNKFDIHIKKIKNKKSNWTDISIFSDYSNIQKISKITSKIENCDLLILLLSPDFFASDAVDIIVKQFEKFPKLHKVGIVLRPCLWDLFFANSELIIFPEDGESVSIFTETDTSLVKISRYIIEQIDSISKNK